ncbi:DNA repair protein (RadC), partial [mine drainage metagenome]
MSRIQLLPGMGVFESEPLSSAKLRDEPDWALVERITGKKCPETVNLRTLSRMTQTELRETLGLTDV